MATETQTNAAESALELVSSTGLRLVRWGCAGVAGALLALTVVPTALGPTFADIVARINALVPAALSVGVLGALAALFSVGAVRVGPASAALAAACFAVIGFGVFSAPLAFGNGPSLLAEVVVGGHAWLSAVLLLATVTALIYIAPGAGGDAALARLVRAFGVFLFTAAVIWALPFALAFAGGMMSR